MRGHQAGRDSGLWTLDPVRSAQPRTVSGPSPRSTLRTAATSPWGRNTQSAVSTHTHILDSSTPRARGGGQAPRHILYVPCPLGGGGISVPTLYMRKLEPGGGEACSRSLSQGAVKRGPEVWRVSHKSLQTRFLQLPHPPPDQCLGPDQKASAAALSDVRGSPGGGGSPSADWSSTGAPERCVAPARGSVRGRLCGRFLEPLLLDLVCDLSPPGQVGAGGAQRPG